MGNMKKIIILIVSFLLVSIAIIIYWVNYNTTIQLEAKSNNKTYEWFYDRQVLGTDIATLINKALDSNEQNEIEKDANTVYIENDPDSIKIDIKFLELDKDVPMESIGKQGIARFLKNFGAASFRCTKIEYHEKTNKVSYMYIEQVNS